MPLLEPFFRSKTNYARGGKETPRNTVSKRWLGKIAKTEKKREWRLKVSLVAFTVAILFFVSVTVATTVTMWHSWVEVPVNGGNIYNVFYN